MPLESCGPLTAFRCSPRSTLRTPASPRPAWSDDPEARNTVAGQRTSIPDTKKRYLAVLQAAPFHAASHEVRLIASNPVAGIRVGGAADGKGKERKAGTGSILWAAEREAAWRRGFEAQVVRSLTEIRASGTACNHRQPQRCLAASGGTADARLCPSLSQ